MAQVTSATHSANWKSGAYGKGFVLNNGAIHTWNVGGDWDGMPTHIGYYIDQFLDSVSGAYESYDENVQNSFWIAPGGTVTTSKEDPHLVPLLQQLHPEITEDVQQWKFASNFIDVVHVPSGWDGKGWDGSGQFNSHEPFYFASLDQYKSPYANELVEHLNGIDEVELEPLSPHHDSPDQFVVASGNPCPEHEYEPGEDENQYGHPEKYWHCNACGYHRPYPKGELSVIKSAEKIPSADELEPYRDSEMCWEYAQGIENKWPHLKQHSGFYNHPRKGPGDHSWNVAPDGTIIDTTAQQHGRNHPEIITPDMPEYKRYVSYTSHEEQAQQIAHQRGWHDRPQDYAEVCPECAKSQGLVSRIKSGLRFGKKRNSSARNGKTNKRSRNQVMINNESGKHDDDANQPKDQATDKPVDVFHDWKLADSFDPDKYEGPDIPVHFVEGDYEPYEDAVFVTNKNWEARLPWIKSPEGFFVGQPAQEHLSLIENATQQGLIKEPAPAQFTYGTAMIGPNFNNSIPHGRIGMLSGLSGSIKPAVKDMLTNALKEHHPDVPWHWGEEKPPRYNFGAIRGDLRASNHLNASLPEKHAVVDPDTLLDWSKGRKGKGLLLRDGELITWVIDDYQSPYHLDVEKALGQEGQAYLVIDEQGATELLGADDPAVAWKSIHEQNPKLKLKSIDDTYWRFEASGGSLLPARDMVNQYAIRSQVPEGIEVHFHGGAPEDHGHGYPAIFDKRRKELHIGPDGGWHWNMIQNNPVLEESVDNPEAGAGNEWVEWVDAPQPNSNWVLGRFYDGQFEWYGPPPGFGVNHYDDWRFGAYDSERQIESWDNG